MEKNHIIKEILKIIEEVVEKKTFVELSSLEKIKLKDMGIDSLLLFKFLTKIENHFNFTFKDEDLDANNFKNLGATALLIEKYIG